VPECCEKESENNPNPTHCSDMTPTIDQLAGAIFHLGYDDEDMYPTADIPFAIWVELRKRGHVERGPSGEPALTAMGQKTFSAMEPGDDVPEFDSEAHM
jgi:hypothetical protein